MSTRTLLLLYLLYFFDLLCRFLHEILEYSNVEFDLIIKLPIRFHSMKLAIRFHFIFLLIASCCCHNFANVDLES